MCFRGGIKITVIELNASIPKNGVKKFLYYDFRDFQGKLISILALISYPASVRVSSLELGSVAFHSHIDFLVPSVVPWSVSPLKERFAFLSICKLRRGSR